LFAAHGFEATRVREIALACRVNEAILYRHFRSKADLFEAALRHAIERHDPASFLRDLPLDGSYEAVFEAIARRILAVGLDDPDVHRLLLAASIAGLVTTRSAYVTWRVPYVQHLEAVVRRGIERGDLRNVDALLTARAFVGMVMDCVLSCRLWSEIGYDEVYPSALVDNNVPTFVRGLRRHPEE
jgi:AcrR family transcriptional regulator